MSEMSLQVPGETEALIAHLQMHHHDRHRHALADLLPLAQRVEDVHWGDPDLPQGLANLVEDWGRDLEEHMAKEKVLFPLMIRGDYQTIHQPIAGMRHDHEELERSAKALSDLTHGFAPPIHACVSWRRLYAELALLAAELESTMDLENNSHFPRFK